ncbi:MAG TPA: hypothetical protein DIV41_05715, partial [Ruminococcaceae bacterium]|nr:hypothetical protein [Oscillospiraceae bacterium]
NKVNDLENKVDTLGNKVNALDGKADTLDSKVNNLDSKVGTLDNKVNTLEKKVDTLEKGQKEINVKIGLLQEDAAITRSGVNTLLDWAEKAQAEVKIPLYKKA